VKNNQPQLIVVS